MALIRVEPARELASLQGEMNQLFSTFFGDSTGSTGNGSSRRWVPAMDLVETADHFVVRADLPGLTESDISIELEDNVLTISGVLEVRIPKPEQRKPQKVSIGVGGKQAAIEGTETGEPAEKS